MQYGTPVYGPPIMQYGPPPKKKTKKRVAVVAAVAAAGLASAGVYATALTVTANQDSAGVSAVTSCDDTVTTQTSPPVWVTDEWQNADLTVGGIDPLCTGQTVYVQPLDAEGDPVGAGFNAVFNTAAQGHATDVLFANVNLPTDEIADFAIAIHES